jgi:NNP family nitrate/nitrite transporter-like MFS transporter
MAASKDILGGYAFGFAVWALMNVAAFYIVLSRVGFRNTKPLAEQPEILTARSSA